MNGMLNNYLNKVNLLKKIIIKIKNVNFIFSFLIYNNIY